WLTSTTPHEARATSPNAPAAGISPRPGLFCAHQSTAPCPAPAAETSSHGRCPAADTPPAPRTPASTVGPNDRSATEVDREQEVGVEAGCVPGVAGRPVLVNLHQKRVLVTVEPHLLDVLRVAGGLSLHPVLAAAARPVG